MTVPFDWSDQNALTYSELFPRESVNNAYFNHVRRFFFYFFTDDLIAFHYVSTRRQSAFITHRGVESALFFDIGQSLILRNILNVFHHGGDCFVIANILKSSSSLYISQRDGQYTTVLNKMALSSPYEEYFYLTTPEQLAIHKTNITRIRYFAGLPAFTELVDMFILGHEAYHYMKRRNLNEVLATEINANEFFDYALNECCYEDREDFANIATFYGQVEISDDNLESIRKELKSRRIYYMAKQPILTEEISCDTFSFMALAELFFAHNEQSITSFLDFTCFFFTIFSFLDLHFAINKRAQLSSVSSIEAIKSPEMADINLRKTALIEVMYTYGYQKAIFQNEPGLPNTLIRSDYIEIIRQLKGAIDHLYLMPVTLLAKNWLLRAEAYRENISNSEIIPFELNTLNKDLLFNLSLHRDAFITEPSTAG